MPCNHSLPKEPLEFEKFTAYFHNTSIVTAEKTQSQMSCRSSPTIFSLWSSLKEQHMVNLHGAMLNIWGQEHTPFNVEVVQKSLISVPLMRRCFSHSDDQVNMKPNISLADILFWYILYRKYSSKLKLPRPLVILHY